MNPAKANLNKTIELTDLPNVGPSIAADLRTIGVNQPRDLIGQDPVALYHALNAVTKQTHDPCILDVFLSIVDFMSGNEAKPWWKYTAVRKELWKAEIK